MHVPSPPPPHLPTDAARLDELRSFDVLDTAADADIDALTRLAAQLCGAPAATVSLVDTDRQWFLSRLGVGATETPRDVSFCTHTIGGEDLFEVRDATIDPRFAGTPLVVGDPHVVFYAGTPLRTSSGHAIGALCVIDHAPRTLTDDQREVLRLLGRQVMRRLEQQRSLKVLQALSQDRRVHLEQLQHYADTLALSEQRLAMVLAAVGAGYWDWDLVTGTVTFSARFGALFHLPGEAPLPVEALFAALDDPDLEALHGAFAELFTRRTERLLYEFQIRQPDREPAWIRFRGQVAAWSAAGEPLRALGLAVDITEDRWRDEQMRTAQKLEAIGALAAGVAHEINTPLQFVSHNLDFLATQSGAMAERLTVPADDPSGTDHDDARTLHDDVASAIAESIDGLDRVTRIVRALKEFSHQGRGGLERVDVNQMIENAITLTRNEWKFAAVVERDLAAGLPLVTAAGYECGQLLVNLIVNAAHAITATGVDAPRGVITVRTRLVHGQVEIRLSDTGTGIPAEIQARMFEPFFTTKRVGQGTGQGLATARAIVERHGGTIGFETEVGRGTTFIVRFPAASGSVQAA